MSSCTNHALKKPTLVVQANTPSVLSHSHNGLVKIPIIYITRCLLHIAWSRFVLYSLSQTFYLVPEFNVHNQVDTKVADMMYVAEVTEPRTFDEPSRMRLVNNIADHVTRYNGKQLCH